MTEPVREPPHPQTAVEPVDAERELARRNNVLGFALLGVFLLLAGGVVIVALVYDSLANY